MFSILSKLLCCPPRSSNESDQNLLELSDIPESSDQNLLDPSDLSDFPDLTLIDDKNFPELIKELSENLYDKLPLAQLVYLVCGICSIYVIDKFKKKVNNFSFKISTFEIEQVLKKVKELNSSNAIIDLFTDIAVIYAGLDKDLLKNFILIFGADQIKENIKSLKKHANLLIAKSDGKQITIASTYWLEKNEFKELLDIDLHRDSNGIFKDRSYFTDNNNLLESIKWRLSYNNRKRSRKNIAEIFKEDPEAKKDYDDLFEKVIKPSFKSYETLDNLISNLENFLNQNGYIKNTQLDNDRPEDDQKINDGKQEIESAETIFNT